MTTPKGASPKPPASESGEAGLEGMTATAWSKRLKTLTTMDFVGIGAGIAVFVFSFFPFQSKNGCNPYYFDRCSEAYGWSSSWTTFPTYNVPLIAIAAVLFILFKKPMFALAGLSLNALLILVGVMWAAMRGGIDPTFGAALVLGATATGIAATYGTFGDLKAWFLESELGRWMTTQAAAHREARVLAATAAAEHQAQAAEFAEKQAHAQRVAAIQQWEQAYRDAHGGAEPPPGFMPPVSAPAAYATPSATYPAAYPPSYGANPNAGTNVFAILSFVFGFLGGALALPFGFVALSQVKRTRERGKGLAIAGIILGSLWILALVAIWIVALTLAASY